MCGITGIYAFNEVGRYNLMNLHNATETVHHRGPDAGNTFLEGRVGLGHRRLSIIDTSAAGNQPMQDSTGRFTIVYNGEIYNFRELRSRLVEKGVHFKSHTDTEVLLYLFIQEGKACLEKLNGFFAFAIYDREKDEIFLARDRYGIKPLFYYFDEDKLIFGSELKSVLAFGIEKSLNYNALFQYLQFNYIAAPQTILQQVYKLPPGYFITAGKPLGENIAPKPYYRLPYDRFSINTNRLSFKDQQEKLKDLLEKSVEERLVADVPVGTFLSGGIDSSIITALAAQYKNPLHTFSIGYRDAPFFDETDYAETVANHLNTTHTTFSLTNDDLLENLFKMADYWDEPFGDSSALPFYILSKKVSDHIKVALSGDGADELFGGYNKHRATLRSLFPGLTEKMVAKLGGLWKILPQSRNNFFGNTIRQLNRFASGIEKTPSQRYLHWATYLSEEEAVNLLSNESLENTAFDIYQEWTAQITSIINEANPNINDHLFTDMQLVLPDDMLRKVDMMSMANGLEVRVPFLSQKVVEFAFQLPSSSKINPEMQKRILQEAFKAYLPAKIYNRPKKGFEVPLLKWFRNELKSTINNDLLKEDFIEAQNIFDKDGISRLKEKLFSKNPGDSHATIWALMVFQMWWKKFLRDA